MCVCDAGFQITRTVVQRQFRSWSGKVPDVLSPNSVCPQRGQYWPTGEGRTVINYGSQFKARSHRKVHSRQLRLLPCEYAVDTFRS